MDFIALDVETANPDMASICAIGLCRFEAGQVAGHMHFLVNPEDWFSGLNVGIHGIEPEMVKGAPTMRQVLPVMARALSGRIVLHHTHFDRVALKQAAARHDHPALDCRWLDTARVARRAWEDVALAGYGLRPLADMLEIEFRHHDAREDARATGLVLIEAVKRSGIDLDGWFARVEGPLDLARAGKERAKFAGNPNGHLAGETVVFTGALSLPRIDASEMAAAAGCDVHPGVTKETTILVVGDQDVRRVGAVGKSAKHQKAESLVAAGAALRIIGETDFQTLIIR